MPSAEIITIGTELLLGEIVDTNSAFLARKLRDLGVDVFRTSTVGDNPARIAAILRETWGRAAIIITTGGLGPTVDDPTREAVSLAIGAPTEFRPELWEQIQARIRRYGRTPAENQKRQAYIPEGAMAINNPVGTAPAFIVERDDHVIISLPGVPREMEYLTEHTVIPYLRGRFQLTGVIKTRLLHTSGAAEAAIDERIGDLEAQGNPTVGLAAHAGTIDIRITAKADSPEAADALIARTEADIRQRLGDLVFGADQDTLEHLCLSRVDQRGWTLAVVEAGLAGMLVERLSRTQMQAYLGGESLPFLAYGTPIKAAVLTEMEARGATAGLGIALHHGEEKIDFEIVLISPQKQETHHRSFGGHPRYAPEWASNAALDLLRRAAGA
jgi:competence/damage-inducible protein CinA-like protein